MSSPHPTPENLPGTTPETNRSTPLPRLSGPAKKGLMIAALALPLIGAVLFVFKPGAGPQALADPPHAAPVVLNATDLRAALPPQTQEGQPTELRLHLQLSHQVGPIKLKLSYADTSYTGEAKNVSQNLEWGGEALTVPLIFESPGKKTIEIKNSENALLKTLPIEVQPFPATVFPKAWEQYKDMETNNPQRFKIWANLFYDEKKAPKQRQYVQITYDDRIVDRFLVSSGAPGHATPTGKYKLGFKDYYPRSARYNNTPMPFWSAINVNGVQGEYGFHSLEDGGYLYLLGRPASHGCIRLSRLPSVETDPKTGVKSWGDRGGARWIYDRVPPETPVTIFKTMLTSFEFQDYEGYLIAQAKAAQAALAEKKNKASENKQNG
ncbi:MAG: L,D-transpeptidase [Candidatus Sericytochromatia bacterium]|nr:L,D-transpeptidase [Candidatus Sericytochromatia bacterium]